MDTRIARSATRRPSQLDRSAMGRVGGHAAHATRSAGRPACGRWRFTRPTSARGARHWLSALTLTAMCTGTCASAAAAAAAPGSCLARSGPEAATVVELYTSEGCSSCPPADRWLSALKGRPDVLALAFHVDYWDALGWPDRFASPEHTRRQRAQMRPSGARFIYTPQVLAHGLDWRWRERPLPRRTPSMIDLHVSWDGRTARAQVQPVPGGPQLLSAYWAVLEDGLATRVGAGENRGAHLRHDHVVREYQPVAAWRASDATPRQPNAEGQASARSHSLTWVPQALEGQRRLVLVVNDAETGRPLNALALRCP